MQDFINAMTAWGLVPQNSSDIIPTATSRLIKDIKGEKTIYYSLIIDGDFAYGRWYDCRAGEGKSWWTKAPKEQRKAWSERVEKLEAEAEAEQQRRYAEVAASCSSRYLGLETCDNHPYLTAKGISAVPNLRIEGHDLVIPAVGLDGAVKTLQTITPAGDKRFVFGGEKKGHFFPIGLRKSEAYERIVIVEGLATGISVFEAMGGPVIVAFDRGNLCPVARVLREKWPDATLVFAADNDEKAPGDPTNDTNPGVWSAQQAAVKVGGNVLVVWPPIAGTDWNDYATTTDKTLEILVQASKPESDALIPPRHSKPSDSGDLITYGDYNPYDSVYFVEKYDAPQEIMRADGNPKWFDEFIFEKAPTQRLASMLSIAEHHDGKSLNNTVIFVREHYKGLFVLNEFSDEIIVRKCPPWEKEHEFRVHRLSDNDVTMMTATLEYYGFKPSVERTRAAIEAVANIHRIHPVRQYFSSLQWDGVPRLGTWLEYYCGATVQPHEYLERIGTMWLVAGVKRVFEPGAVFHNMLVLEGKTNIGKSRTLKALATFGKDIEEEYFTDAVRFKHIDKPAALQILQGKLIVEFAELADMDGESDESLKAWITQSSDEMIKKWAKYPTKYPRQFILAGSTNNDNWLRDPTGNRRYWPVRCLSFKSDEINRDKEQLWAEAVQLYKDGYSITMPDSDPVYRIAKAEQAMRLMDDPWGDILAKEVHGKPFVTYEQLYAWLCIPIKDRDTDTDRRIRGAMQNIGWEFKVAYAESKMKNKVWMKRA